MAKFFCPYFHAFEVELVAGPFPLPAGYELPCPVCGLLPVAVRTTAVEIVKLNGDLQNVPPTNMPPMPGSCCGGGYSC